MSYAFASLAPVGARNVLLSSPSCTSGALRNVPTASMSVQSPGRRAFVVALAALALPALAPTRAERTDKSSPKQGAKRAYLAGILAGMEALRQLSGAVYQQGSAAGWTRAVADFVSGPAKDMNSALEQLADSYVSSGQGGENTEQRLKEVQINLYNAISELGKSAKSGDEAGSVANYHWAVGAANDYIVAADLKDYIAPLNPGG
jgi:hypothetical protein